jgi:hypothetical protein
MKAGTSKSTGKISKGAPSGMVISLMVHAGAFFVAGLFVVFTVVNKPEPEFISPPSIERPKMKLKKPKVKVKKSSQPKPSSRIVAKVRTKQMPEIQLPDLMGTGEGLIGGIGLGGDFLDLPDLSQDNLIGSSVSSGNDLVATFYDFKRKRNGQYCSMTQDECKNIFYDFLKNDWDPAYFAKYYRSPRKFYASTVMIPPARANLAPEIFGEDIEGYNWGLHYQGELTTSKDIRFRFWGSALHLMAVRVDGEIVLLSTWHRDFESSDLTDVYIDLWHSKAPENYTYLMEWCTAEVGDWIELKAGESKPIEVVAAIFSGGLFQATLCVEVEGEDYPKNIFGGPILPAFKTARLSRALLDEIEVNLYPGTACLTNGPIFCDLQQSDVEQAEEVPASEDWGGMADEEEPAINPNGGMRDWITLDGKSIRAEYVDLVIDKVVLKNEEGIEAKLPLNQLSAEDREFVDLLNPPKFSLDFLNKRKKKQEGFNITEISTTRPVSRFIYRFGARLKRRGGKRYEHPLTIEYFAIGDEAKTSDKHMLLERKKSTFTPNAENKGVHEFEGDPVDLIVWGRAATKPLIGRKFGGYLITVTDERGVIIQHEESNPWLWEHFENLTKLPVNSYFNEACERTGPTRPPADVLNM